LRAIANIARVIIHAVFMGVKKNLVNAGANILSSIILILTALTIVRRYI
jgi:hypothetical protein